MKNLLCVTGNESKFRIGEAWFAKYDIKLQQVVTDIDEIQGEDPELIIRDKAAKAFGATGKPVVVTDDSWDIPALNGFPGAYMKSINHWFDAKELLNLLTSLEDRRIILHQFVAYQDEFECVVFNKDISGMILREAHGESGPASSKIILLDSDIDKTISQIHDEGLTGDPERLKKRSDSWEELAKWYSEKIAV